MTTDDLIVALLEEGAPLALVARATGLPVEELEKLPIDRKVRVMDDEELSIATGRLANLAINTLTDLMVTGSPAMRVRAAGVVIGYPMRRMGTDQSKQMDAMKGMLDEIMSGGRDNVEGDD